MKNPNIKMALILFVLVTYCQIMLVRYDDIS